MNCDNLPSIALAQMEVKPGRPDLNAARMKELMGQARDAGAELVVFSELCVSGYVIGDLWEVDALVEDFAAYSDEIRAASKGLTAIFGNVVVDRERIGEDGRLRKYNAVQVCSDGRFVERADIPDGLPAGVQPKTLQPNYRFFDDDRHFYSLRKLAQCQDRSLYDWIAPFEVELCNGDAFRFGVQLCEDIWCQDYCYQQEILNTLKVYHQRGAQAIFNLSSSPWTWQKNDKRNRVVREILAGSPLPFFYVNQVGAQNNGKNIIVFDGDTTAYAAHGEVIGRAQHWREQLLLTSNMPEVAEMQGETEGVYDAILAGIRHLDHIRGGENNFLIGTSGGIDSSLVVCLLAQAVGPERVYAVNMPTRFNAEVTQENARQLCDQLGVDYLSCPIQDLYENLARKIEGVEFSRGAGNYTRLVDENLQARIRGADMLAGLAAKYGLIFTNNGNKTEVALGYATLYGDINGAVAPIADLYKVQVIELARFLNDRIFGREVIPENLIGGTIVPSAELSEAQDVTKGLGDPIKYGYHDAVLRQMIEYRRHPVDFLRWFIDETLFEQLGWSDRKKFETYFPDAQSWVEDLEWVDRQMRINYFKRIQAPPIIVLSKRAFGFDLRESQLPEYRPRIYEQLKAKALALGEVP
ncbi:MAG: NAD(+) synthase [Gemmatimonadetes bacterium]|jgi:NAD+ synthase (glutamine-hydrolysing)|nr:NAD(+) synthase [Gemmatimonadota bacterium]